MLGYVWGENNMPLANQKQVVQGLVATDRAALIIKQMHF